MKKLGTEVLASPNHPTKVILLFIACSAIAFDFRRTDGDDGLAVVALGLLTLISLIGIVFLSRRVRTKFLFFILPFFILFAVSVFVGTLRGDNVISVLSSSFPLLTFSFAYLAIAELAESPLSLQKVFGAILFSALLSAIWKCAFAFTYYGLDMTNVRYQILSGATPLLFSYFLASFFVQRRSFALFALFISLGVVFVSVTRTYLISLTLCLVPFLVFLPRIRKGIDLSMVAPIIFISSLSLVIIQVFAPTMLDRWTSRIFQFETSGFDITAASRLSQLEDQVQQLSNSSSGLVFGFGPTASSRLSDQASGQALRAVLGQGADKWEDSGYGHNQFVGFIFVGGLLGGLPALFGFLVLIRQALSIGVSRSWSKAEVFAFFWGSSAVMSYVGYSFFGAPFIDRSMSFYFGAAVGLMFVGRYGVRKT